MASTMTQISELYVAIFNRASEGSGNSYWAGLDSSTAEIAQIMLGSTDAQDYFGGDPLDPDVISNQDFVEYIYLNTLNKTLADDPDGIAFWVGRLDAGQTRGQVSADLVDAANDPANAGDAQDQFQNRVAVSDYTAENLEDVPDDYATSLSFTSANNPNGALTVTSDPATIDDATDQVDTLVPAAYTMTADADQVNEGSVITYTVVADKVVDHDVDVTFTINALPNPPVGAVPVPGEAIVADFSGGAMNPVTVTILAGSTTATFNMSPILDGLTEVPENYSVTAEVNGDELSVDSVILDGAAARNTFNLESVDANGGLAMRLTGDMATRIDFTDPANQITGQDLNGNGIIERDGVENNISGVAANFNFIDAYARAPLNIGDTANNFIGDLEFDGTGFDGDGTNSDGNIFLGGLGDDTAFGGIGNDFMTSGQDGFDQLYGGRNADFFFVELSELSNVNGDTLTIDGGSTWDDDANQDSDWLLLDSSDDDEPVTIQLDNNAGSVQTASGVFAETDDLEHLNASGSLFSVLDGFGTELGGSDSDHYTLGTTAQLIVNDLNGDDNIIIAGYDNDTVNANAGNDILFGGDMQFLTRNQNNPNILNIPNDGRDTLNGGAGDDNIHFEMDGGTVDGGNDTDTLWLTDFSGGMEDSAAAKTSDGVVRIDLQSALGDSAGYGGADVDGTSDQSNYTDENSGLRNTTVNMENVNATGLGAIDFNPYGTNDIDHTENYFGITDANLDLRGTNNDNDLYANTGNDVIEGRGGNDNMMGGLGQDDFVFNAGVGDGLDVIHRLIDADGDNIWDTDAEGNGIFGQDFGDNGEIITSDSSLTLTLIDNNNPAAELANIPVNGIAFSLDGVDYLVQSDAMGASGLYTEFTDALNAALDADADLAETVAVLNADNTITITDPAGRTFVETGYTWVGNIVPPVGDIEWGMVVGGPDVEQANDRLIYTNYENRADGELVDDDAITGSAVSLGTQSYAEDKVISFSDDGTRISESQQYQINFDNLAVEDTVTVDVNGVKYSLQVGVAADGTLINNETTDAFVARLAAYITNFLDDDTAAGDLVSAVVALGGANSEALTISEVDYKGEETVFLQTPIVTITNASGGEPATATVINQSAHEVHLLDFDGRDNNLNADNVIFQGDTGINRAVLATAETAGGTLNGSDAVVIDSAQGDAINSAAPGEGLNGSDISYSEDPNLATQFPENFAVHGDDLLIGADGDDVINGGTGDDRVHGSRGNDTLDGGKNLYLQDGVVRVYNEFEAAQADAQPDVISIELINQTENGNVLASGIYDDTLLFQQSDFGNVGVGGSEFTITLDNDATFPEGGAGTVVTTENGVVTGTTRFTNFENVRTVSGDGTLAGQGNDTLILSGLSNNSGGVRYNLTAGDGQVEVDNDLNDFDPTAPALEDYTDARDWADFFIVDGVENVVTGNGEDIVVIDETEAGKNNNIDTGLGTDAVEYSFNVGGGANAFNPALTLTVNAEADTDYMDMTGGLVGLDVPRDVLTSVEIIHLGDAARNPALDDTLDVTHVNDAIVDFVNGEVRDGDTNLVQVDIRNMDDFEIVNADFSDTVIVSDAMANSRISNVESNVAFNSFLNYDLLDERDVVNGGAPVRLSVGELRTIPAGTVDTADEGDIPEAENIGLYTFNMGDNADTVDYSNETGLIAAVANFDNATSISVNNVLVSHNGNTDFTDNGNRVDAITDNENLVASSGTSIIDLTNAQTGLKVRFNADDGATSTDPALDRDVYRIQLSELATTVPVQGLNFLEYADAGDNAAVNQIAASWGQVEGSDHDVMVEFTDHDSTSEHTLNLRGGDNEVNYNELTKSINLEIGLDGVDNEFVGAQVTFTDGNGAPLVGGQTDFINTHSAGNTVAAGSLRIEASQDAEDSVSFDFGNFSDKLFILGGLVDGSDTITVHLGDQNDSIELTGFELLLDDAGTDDIYRMEDLDRTVNNLTLTDGLPAGDRDTIVVGNDAVGYQATPADTISLEELNDELNFFDFDILDITEVTSSGLTIVGDTDFGRNLNDQLVLGNLDHVDDVQLFTSLALTDASGSSFDLDLDAGELQDGSGVTELTFDALVSEIDASRMTNDVAITVTGGLLGTVSVIGGSGDDTLTGGDSDNEITGGLGADIMDGSLTPAVARVETIEFTGGLDANPASAFGLNGLVLFEGAFGNPIQYDTGIGQTQMATQIAALINEDIALGGANQSGLRDEVTSVTSEGGLITVEFVPGVAANVVPFAPVFVPDTGTMLMGSASVNPGADVIFTSDTFIYNDAAESVTDSMDVISNFTINAGGEDDVLDIAFANNQHGLLNGGSGFDDMAAVVAAAEASFAAHNSTAYVGSDGTDTWVLVDVDHGQSSDMIIELAGITAAGFDNDNIIL